jgi:lysophospholipase L1-like esterase
MLAFSPSVPGELRILAFGASLVEGYTDYGRDFHPFTIALQNKLSTLLPDQNVVIQVNGQSGDYVLESLGGTYLKRLQLSAQPPKSGSPPSYDLVILLGGTNDLGHLFTKQDSATDILEGLKKCYQHVISSGSNILCLTVPERRIDTLSSAMAIKYRNARLRLNEFIQAYVQDCQKNHKPDEPSAYLWDMARHAPFSVEQGRWSPDDLHMSAHGYDFVGEEIATFIYSILFA